jgi:hypothetical protein
MPIQLQGKSYVTHEELVQWATEEGLESVTTEILHIDLPKMECVVQATAKGKRGTYQGLGDCLPNINGNVGKMISAHFVRMAETRAINRCLRLYTGRGATSIDELGDTGGRSAPSRQEPTRDAPPVQHHPSWDADRPRFMQALGETGLDYEKQVKPWALSVGAGKPSTWPQEDRVRLINDLKSGKVRIS